MPKGYIFDCEECQDVGLVLMDDQDEVTCDCGQVYIHPDNDTKAGQDGA